MTVTNGWRELYMTRLRENQDGFSYTQSATILQQLYRECYATVHGVQWQPTEWQANVPTHLLNTKGLADVCSWLVQRIEELTYPTICVDLS